MSALAPYLPQDRRRALAENHSLPDRAIGAVLFADVSGFTALSEAMTRSLGARRGAEELTARLNAVYDAVIAQIENYGGSVISFAGDAALSWFAETDDRRAASRAVTCAFALQNEMRRFAVVPLPDNTTAALAIKVAVAFGSVRRFVIGDPTIRRIDVIAGSTVTRTAAAEQLAQPGEILIDAAAAQALDGQIEIVAWRPTPDAAERFAVLQALRAPAAPPPALPPSLTLSEAQIRPWLDAAVYERVRVKGDTFLTELRPVVALFARFQGIAFDADDAAGEKLDQLIARAQRILARYDGALLELTIGDKGSYFYATFGAPHAHEDDARRAVLAARELFPLCAELGFLEPLQAGISQGVMRVGAYGGAMRRTYGAQGDEANLAARLMTEAAPGMLLVSGHIQKTIANEFDLEPLPPIRLKGKAEPLLPFIVQGLRETRVQQLQEAYYALPMIGREQERALILEKLERARAGAGQIIGVTARAGTGKSRLAAEVIRTVRRQRESSYGSECQSFGQNISYSAWAPIWRAFFGVDANMAPRRQIRALEGQLAELAPERADALPLLGKLLDLPIPENDFTRALEPEFRRSALHALLRECLAAAAQEARAQKQILLFVIEDLHWIDPASRELLQELASGIANLPVAFLLNYRPPENRAERLPRLASLPNFTEITLADLTDAQGEGLIRAKLAQYAPENVHAISPALIARVNAQAQGNPFYIEQLLDYMHDLGLNLRDPNLFENVELPNTLHRLILSRLDQLNEPQQRVLKTASVIGRVFRLAHLCGYFPDVGSLEEVRAALALLAQYDLTSVDPDSVELTYLFKHIVTHQVAYESLTYATRAALHEAYAHFIETQSDPERTLDLIAYHYDRSANLPKRKEYLRRAGQAAAARFANIEAADYLTRALAIAQPDEYEERYAVLTLRERVFDVQGERQRQRADLETLAEVSFGLTDPSKHLQVLLRQAWFTERLMEHNNAQEFLRQFDETFKVVALPEDARRDFEMEVALLHGVVLWQQGNALDARPHLTQALEFARQTANRTAQIRALGFLGAVHRDLGDYANAYSNHLEQLQIARADDDRRRECVALDNLGWIAQARGEFDQAIENFTQALQSVQEIGDRAGESMLLCDIAIPFLYLGEYDHSLAYLEKGLELARTIGERRSACRTVVTIGECYRLIGQTAEAERQTQEGLQLARELGDQLNQAIALSNMCAIALKEGELDSARELTGEALRLARAIGHREGEGFLLNCLGRAQLGLGKLSDARETFEQALAVWQTLEPSPYSLQAYAGLAELAMRQNDSERARASCDAIFEFLRQNTQRAGDPSALAALLTCYHAQRAVNDPAAFATLERAYRDLQARADKISNAEMKRSFLGNVPANAQIVEEWNARR